MLIQERYFSALRARINKSGRLNYDDGMATRKVPERDERLIEEFNKLKNPQAQPLSKLKAGKTRKVRPKKPGNYQER